MNIKDILIKISKTLDNGWTQHALAVDKHGMAVSVHDPNATCFCMSGAIEKEFDAVNHKQHLHVRELIESTISDELKRFVSIPNYNDAPGRTKADCIGILHKTISKLNTN